MRTLTAAGDFRPAAETMPQDWAALGRWLEAHGRSLDDDVAPRQFRSGLANLNYLVSLDGTPAVLRRPPQGPTAEGANDMAREWRVLTGLDGRFDLAPAPLAFCDDVSVLGAPFQLIEFRSGTAIGATVPAAIAAPGTGARLTTALLTAMAALHRVDVDGFADLGRPEGFLERQVAGWARRSRAAFGDDEPGCVEQIVATLRASLPDSRSVSLVHCDLKFDNTLFDLDTLRPVALVDWDMATRGDPLFDLGVLLSYWVQAGDPEDVHVLRQVPSLEAGFPTRAAVAAEYFELSGTAPVDLSFHVTLARFRLAVAWQQMYVQYQRGALVDPRYETFSQLARDVLAWTAKTRDDPLGDPS